MATQIPRTCCRRAIVLLGAFTTLLGLLGCAGYLAQQPKLLSVFPDLPPIALLTAVAFLWMGLSIITILLPPKENHPPDALPSQWMRVLQWLSMVATASIGVYCVGHHVQLAQFTPGRIQLLGRETYLVPTLMTSSRILLSGLAVWLFHTRKQHDPIVAYVICPIGLYLIFTSLFALTGHLFHFPLLYNNMVSVPASLGFIFMGLAIMVGTIPYNGLFLPFLSTDKTSRMISACATLLSIVLLGYGTATIALTFQHTRSAALSLEASQVFFNAELVTVIIAILFEMIALRAIYYRNEAMFHTALEMQTAQTLQASEERYRFVIEGSNDGIWDWDLPENFCYWNDRAYEILDIEKPLTSPEFETLLNRIAPQDRAHVQVARKALVTDSTPYNVEYKLQLPSGDYRYCLSRGRVTQWDANGKPIRISGSITDITALKQAEARLGETQQMLHRVMEGANDGIWEWNLHTNKILWNDRQFEMLGLQPQPEIDFSWFELLVHPDDLPRIHERIQAHLEHNETFQIEERFRHSAGHYIHCYVRGKAIRDEQGKPLLFSGISTDISQLKETEQALRETSRKLAQSNQDLEHFATVASHDLKAPLRKIRIFNEQVAMEKDRLSPESQDALSRIRNSIDTMQTLIDDLLTWSKASWTSVSMEPVDLSCIVEHVLFNLKPLILETDADIQIKRLDTVTGDTAQLEQLLQNLVENALKYQPPGQKPVVQISASCEDSRFCVMSVEDNGIGIKPEHTERIFQPFERLHGKASPYPGTGVGLALCKRIAERHNGVIEVESTEGKGSRFTVKLPKSINTSENRTTQSRQASPLYSNQ